MARFSDDPQQLVVDLEKYLEEGPQAKQDDLAYIASWLGNLDEAKNESNVKAVQLLGTAAGKQWDEIRTKKFMLVSEMQINNSRCVAGRIPGSWHPRGGFA